MEIKELPKVKSEELTETEKESLFNNIIRGKDVTEKIETSRGIFEVKFPRMSDLEAIGRILAHKMHGYSVESMDRGIYMLMSQIATLDVLVVSGPGWYENAKKEGFFTWGNIPTESFVQEVYAKAYEFRVKVQDILEGNSNEGNKGVATSNDNDVSNKPGLFDGLSDSDG